MNPGDPTHANVARMYDYYLGGGTNFAVDRELADEAIAASPNMVAAVWQFRHFLRRTVRLCTQLGIEQFLDLGSGVPTVGNVHEIARRANPAARASYVDHEPVAVAHSRRLLAGVEGVTITHADLRDPDTVLAAPTVAGNLDFGRPVAVLMLAVLHFLPDSDGPESVVQHYRAVMAPGSALVVSHGSDDYDDPALRSAVRRGQQVYTRSTQPTHQRGRGAIGALFDGLDLVQPGLVDITRWRPDPSSDAMPQVGAYGGLATRR